MPDIRIRFTEAQYAEIDQHTRAIGKAPQAWIASTVAELARIQNNQRAWDDKAAKAKKPKR